jgi:hypothetical protein
VTGHIRKPSPETYLAGSAIVSVVIALVLSRLPQLAFGSFVRMTAVLIAADVVVYVLTKFRLIR